MGAAASDCCESFCSRGRKSGKDEEEVQIETEQLAQPEEVVVTEPVVVVEPQAEEGEPDISKKACPRELWDLNYAW